MQATAPSEWLEDLALELTDLDLMLDLDPGLLVWQAPTGDGR